MNRTTQRTKCVTVDAETLKGQQFINRWRGVGQTQDLGIAVSNGICCGRRHPNGGYCTLEPGHLGIHVAHNVAGNDQMIYVAWHDMEDDQSLFIDIGL